MYRGGELSRRGGGALAARWQRRRRPGRNPPSRAGAAVFGGSLVVPPSWRRISAPPQSAQRSMAGSSGRVACLILATRSGLVIYERFYERLAEAEKAELRAACDEITPPEGAAPGQELVGRFRGGRLVGVASGEVVLYALGTGEYTELARECQRLTGATACSLAPKRALPIRGAASKRRRLAAASRRRSPAARRPARSRRDPARARRDLPRGAARPGAHRRGALRQLRADRARGGRGAQGGHRGAPRPRRGPPRDHAQAAGHSGGRGGGAARPRGRRRLAERPRREALVGAAVGLAPPVI